MEFENIRTTWCKDLCDFASAGVWHFSPGGRAGAEFRAGGARAFIGGTKNSRECVTHTTQWTADAAWALRSPEVGASEHQTLDSSAARALRSPEERSSSNAKPEADHLLVKTVIAARRTLFRS